mmetsp:Transcript_37110/g.106910  ORF Transcript_37110/g.106910 Transcript_37110/m.106910 type:complete len:100 (-) Transcript_37110:262-561(-)
MVTKLAGATQKFYSGMAMGFNILHHPGLSQRLACFLRISTAMSCSAAVQLCKVAFCAQLCEPRLHCFIGQWRWRSRNPTSTSADLIREMAFARCALEPR